MGEPQTRTQYFRSESPSQRLRGLTKVARSAAATTQPSRLRTKRSACCLSRSSTAHPPLSAEQTPLAVCLSQVLERVLTVAVADPDPVARDTVLSELTRLPLSLQVRRQNSASVPRAQHESALDLARFPSAGAARATRPAAAPLHGRRRLGARSPIVLRVSAPARLQFFGLLAIRCSRSARAR